MNLVKNGAVLLAALSVFAITSCNKGDGFKKLENYDAALAWVKEHYTGEKENKGDNASTKVYWDYSKNVIGEEKFPGSLVESQEDLDINGLSQYVLTTMYEVDKEDATNKTKTVTINDSGSLAWDEKTYFNELEFSNTYGPKKNVGRENLEQEFFASGDEMKVTQKYTDERELGGSPYVKAKLDVVETRILDKDGFTRELIYNMYAEDAVVKVTIPQQEHEYHMGKFDFRSTMNEFTFKEVK